MATGILGASIVGAAAPRRPNLIVLVADDLRFDAVGAAGNPIVRTPDLDRLAADGVRFRNAFVSTPICAPSRATIFSGQYQRRHGIDDFAKGFSDAAWQATYPAVLRTAGYRTGFVGKFGVGEVPRAADFDVWQGFAGGGDYFTPERAQHLTAWTGDQAVAFLRAQTADRPFCLSVSFKAPHAQDGAAREFPPDPRDETLYGTTAIPPVGKTEDLFFTRLPAAVQTSEARRRWERRFATPAMSQQTVRDYYRLVTGLDREVGRIRAALAEQGLADHTVVLFTSDNGFHLGERGLADKWFMYEESIRVPLVLVDPGLSPKRRGATTDVMALNVDIAPTLLDYAGTGRPDRLQGRSLRPVAGGQGAPIRHAFLGEHHTYPDIIPPSEAIRTTRWKYIRWLATDPIVEELYDLRRDPEERRNLASEARHRRRLEWGRRRWLRLIQHSR